MSFKQTPMQPVRVDYQCDLCGSPVMPDKSDTQAFYAGVDASRIPHRCVNPQCAEPYVFNNTMGTVYFFALGQMITDEDLITTFTPKEDRV